MNKNTSPTRVSAWSISLAQIFEQCAYRVKLARIDKIPDLQPRPAADRGTQMHSEAEDFVCARGPLTPSLRHFHDDLGALAVHFSEGRVVCEEEWGFDNQWKIAPWKTAWLRLKCDAVCFLTPQHTVVIDYKSGKRFGNEVKHATQLQLYALCALIRYPDVEQVTCELWYLDQNELASFTMHRRQLSKYLCIFDKLGRSITEETAFKPNPNIYSCKYCPYHASKQGDCQFGAPLIVQPKSPVTPEQVIAKAPKLKKTSFDAEMAAEAARLSHGGGMKK